MSSTNAAALLRSAAKTPLKKTKVTIRVSDAETVEFFVHELTAGGRDLLNQAYQARPPDETRAYLVALSARDEDGEPLFPLAVGKDHPTGTDRDGCPVFAPGVIDDLKAVGGTRLEPAWRAACEANGLGGQVAGTDAAGN